jgi:NB-ARC domain
MQTAFQGDGSHRQAIVLQGPAGIGKTQLAVSFIKQRSNLHSAFFWINSRTQDTVERSFLIVAKRIHDHHPSRGLKAALDAADIDQVIEAVKQWLSAKNNTRWMLIFDDFDDPGVPDVGNSQVFDVRSYFPDTYQGFILITTRSSLVNIGQVIQVSKLTNTSESVAILANMSQRAVSDTGIYRTFHIK